MERAQETSDTSAPPRTAAFGEVAGLWEPHLRAVMDIQGADFACLTNIHGDVLASVGRVPPFTLGVGSLAARLVRTATMLAPDGALTPGRVPLVITTRTRAGTLHLVPVTHDVFLSVQCRDGALEHYLVDVAAPRLRQLINGQ